MLMQHVGVGYLGYHRAAIYAMKHSVMPEIAKLRMKALHFWELDERCAGQSCTDLEGVSPSVERTSQTST